jgi:hypothetical protein
MSIMSDGVLTRSWRTYLKNRNRVGQLRCYHCAERIQRGDQIYRRSKASEFNVAITRTVEEASDLMAAGFEFVYEYQGVIIYRRRKLPPNINPYILRNVS